MTRTCQPWMGSTASTLRWLAGTSKEFIRLWGQREGHMSRQRWCTFNHDQGKKYGQSCRHLTAIEALCQPVQGGAMFFVCHKAVHWSTTTTTRECCGTPVKDYTSTATWWPTMWPRISSSFAFLQEADTPSGYCLRGIDAETRFPCWCTEIQF